MTKPWLFVFEPARAGLVARLPAYGPWGPIGGPTIHTIMHDAASAVPGDSSAYCAPDVRSWGFTGAQG